MLDWNESFASLRIRNFRYVWISGIISNAGKFFQAVAIPIVIYDITGDAAWVGRAGLAQLLPMALVMPLSGNLADRYERRSLLLVTQAAQAAVATAFMIFWLVGVRSPIAYVALSVPAGLTSGLNLPAWQAFVSDLVPRHLLLNAITLNSAQFNMARMLGPALAGIVVGAFGPAVGFAVNAVTYFAVILALLAVRIPKIDRPPLEPMHVHRDFIETTRYVRQRHGIATAIASVGLLGLFGLSVQAFIVVFAKDVFGRGDTAYGLMLATVGMGAVAASPVVAGLGGRVKRAKLTFWAFFVYASSVVAFALSPNILVALVPLAVMGMAHITAASTLNTAVQVQVDDNTRAKVLSLYLMVLLTANPIGQGVLGEVMSLTSPRATLVGAGLVMYVGVAGFVLSGSFKGLDTEVSVEEPISQNRPHPRPLDGFGPLGSHGVQDTIDRLGP